MTDNINKLMAEALVECGYALKQKKLSDGNYYIYLDMSNSGNYIREHPANPFADTLEGRKQADALIGVFRNKHNSQGINLWYLSAVKLSQYPDEEEFEFRGRRLKWCFEQLAEKS